MTDREILAAALRWHRAHETRMEANTASNRFKVEQKKLTSFGGADFELSRQVTVTQPI